MSKDSKKPLAQRPEGIAQGYATLLDELKGRIRRSLLQAALAANRELIGSIGTSEPRSSSARSRRAGGALP